MVIFDLIQVVSINFPTFLMSVFIAINLSFMLVRRILIFPKGNNADYLSMYLDVADSATLPYGWSRYAHFSLAVVNQVHSKYSVRKGTETPIIDLLSK